MTAGRAWTPLRETLCVAGQYLQSVNSTQVADRWHLTEIESRTSSPQYPNPGAEYRQSTAENLRSEQALHQQADGDAPHGASNEICLVEKLRRIAEIIRGSDPFNGVEQWVP